MELLKKGLIDTMDKLRSCSFCGGEAAIKAIYKSCGFTIGCQCKHSSCDARTVGYCPNISEEDRALESIESCKNKAAEAWNRRVENAAD